VTVTPVGAAAAWRPVLRHTTSGRKHDPPSACGTDFSPPLSHTIDAGEIIAAQLIRDITRVMARVRFHGMRAGAMSHAVVRRPGMRFDSKTVIARKPFAPEAGLESYDSYGPASHASSVDSRHAFEIEQ